MLNIIFGICLLCLGVYGVTSNWWAVVDFVSTVIPLMLLIFGVFSILAGLNQRKQAHVQNEKRG
jgi:uncharacterized membrane protein HdeD (DUF308 family)